MHTLKTWLNGLVIILVYAFLLSNCSQNNYVEIVETDFKEEVNPQSNLRFTFNQALVGDSLIQVWDTTQYLAIEPRIEGKFKWLSPTELVFSPSKGFQASTDYTVKLKSSLVHGGEGILVSESKEVLSFHTPYLQIEGGEMFWYQDERRTRQLRVNLLFNYKVQPANITSLLKVSSGEENIQNFKILNDEPSRVLEVSIEQLNELSLEGKEIRFEFASGLKCAESNYSTSKVLSKTLLSPSQDELKIEEVRSQYENFQAQIQVRANQSLNIDQINNYLKIRPRVLYEVFPQANGFIIKGSFKPEVNYLLHIDQNLKGVLGASLKEDFQQRVIFGDKGASLSFVEKKGLYLSNQGSKNLAIRIENIPKVRVTVHKVYENNLIHFLRNFSSGDNQSSYRYKRLSQYSGIIHDQEYETKSLTQVQDYRLLNLDLKQIRDNKGVYAVQVSSVDKLWLNSIRIVSLSDIGFIARETSEDIYVFANSILEAQPKAGLDVNLMGENNQVIASQKTDENGLAYFPRVKKLHPQMKIPMITARDADDFNFLYLPSTRVNKYPFETGGYSPSAGNYMAFLYGERDLYRPGETVNFNVLVRSERWQKPGKLPVQLKLKLPNGKDLINMRGVLNEEGAFSHSISLPSNTITGTYQLEVYTLTGQLLASKPISVEEFMPDRIRVALQRMDASYQKVANKALKTGDSLRTQLQAVNLFGPPAANRNYQMEFYLQKKDFKAKGFEDYDFALKNKAITNRLNPLLNLESISREGKTNQQGKARESFFLSPRYNNLGLLKGNVFTTVFDETGRSVSRSIHFDVFTQPIFLGIKQNEYYLSVNRNTAFKLIALRQDESLASTQAEVEVVRYQWQTVLEKSYGDNYRYVSRKKEISVKKQMISIGGRDSEYNFIPQVSGDYEIRVRLADSDTFVSRRFYAYGSSFTENSSFEVDKDGKVDIKFDKEKYQLGETAKVLFTTPFDGRLLVTIERNQVFKHLYLNTANKSAATEFILEEAHLPNVFVTATLVKPLSNGAIPLTVAHGFESVKVEKAGSKLEVNISAIEKSESRTSQNIRVQTSEPYAEVTLAIVDEGILQLKNYSSPKPYPFFFQKRALGVEAYDLYPQLFPEISGNNLATGGGGDLSARGNPMVNKRVKLVRFWSGVLKSNAQGEINYTIDIPSFSGSLRIMAVAYKGAKFGSGQASMKVADPIVVSTGLPRFLSPRDKVKVPVTLINTTNSNSSAIVNLSTSDNLQILSQNSYSTEVKANNEEQLEFEIEAQAVIDSAFVNVKVQAMGRIFEEKIKINIRPTVGLVKYSGGGEVKGGERTQISLPGNIIPKTKKGSFTLSNSPLTQFSASFDYLFNYPYGCVEQVTSSVFPQLYAQDLMKVIQPGLQNVDMYDAQVRENIQEGILRLLSMQNYGGGLSYWPGGYKNSWFGTAYAAHFLLEAKKAGYAVNQSSLNQMLDYLVNQMNNRDTQYYYFYNQDRKRFKKKIVPKEALYSIYVLALAKRPEISMMNFYQENRRLLALDSKYLLAVSYLLIGDQNNYRKLLPSSFQGEESESVFSGSFHSSLRDEALALNALLEGDPGNIQITEMARHLSQALMQKTYLNTQERAFSILALGKIAKMNNAKSVEGEAILGNNTLTYQGKDVQVQNLVGNQIQVQARGEGSLYYFWDLQGLSADSKVKEEDKFLKVRKSFYDREGNIIRNLNFRQNDLVVVKVSIVLGEPISQNVENVVITDMLPAGFEIENPRLSPNREIRWIRSQARPDHYDIRDDRINYFCTAKKKVQNFYYLVRAVSKGTFQMGPVSADAMYNGSFHSYYGSGAIRILDQNDAMN